MNNKIEVFQPKEIEYSAVQNSKSLERIDKALALAQGISDIAPLIQDTLKTIDSITKSIISLKELELKIDFRLKDNQSRRDMLINAFQKSIDHLQKITYIFLDKIDKSDDEKSKDRYTTLLLDVISKSDGLTLELMKKI